MQFKLTPNIFKAMFNDPNLFQGQHTDIQADMLNQLRDVVFQYAEYSDQERDKLNNCPETTIKYRDNFENCMALIEDYAIFIIQYISNPGGSVTVNRIPISDKAKKYEFPFTDRDIDEGGEGRGFIHIADTGRVPIFKVTKIVKYLYQTGWFQSGKESITVTKADLDTLDVAL